jgi:hypothetical protein
VKKYWLVIIPNWEEANDTKSHIIFGTIEELISYATSTNELIETSPYCYFSHVLGVDGKEHPEVLKIIERKLDESKKRLDEIEERMNNSPFKVLRGLFK